MKGDFHIIGVENGRMCSPNLASIAANEKKMKKDIFGQHFTDPVILSWNLSKCPSVEQQATAFEYISTGYDKNTETSLWRLRRKRNIWI